MVVNDHWSFSRQDITHFLMFGFSLSRRAVYFGAEHCQGGDKGDAVEEESEGAQHRDGLRQHRGHRSRGGDLHGRDEGQHAGGH